MVKMVKMIRTTEDSRGDRSSQTVKGERMREVMENGMCVVQWEMGHGYSQSSQIAEKQEPESQACGIHLDTLSSCVY